MTGAVNSAGTGLDPAIEYHVINSLGWRGLRPLQAAAVAPVRSGDDCVLVAPTAGGKTEAALFPLLSEMTGGDWHGTTVLYVTPLRALLNNLYPRVQTYAAWLGRTVGLWHGDVGQSERRRILADRPDVLLTTPESIESMLVSRAVDHRAFFSGIRAIVVDELHSFAAQDRGWHLLAVLERVQRLARRDVQRVGLSATIGNPEEIGYWLQGSGGGVRPSVRVVVEEPAPNAPEPEVLVDYVGSEINSARIIAAMHRGEKRLVFTESRRLAEKLAYELRELSVETYVSHSSLAAEERRLSERAFAEARDCVIVATSTLELGIDIGDLDRVIQIGATRTVSSFLQRLGRTGRRPGTARNTLFLALDDQDLLEIAGILVLWRRGFVEAVQPPPHPRHLAAQQLLALALQEGAFSRESWRDWWGSLTLMDDAPEVLEHLVDEEFLVEDTGLLMIGPRAEKEFGRRHFMELLSSFLAEKELRVLTGTKEIGFVSPLSLPQPDDRVKKPIVLGGRAWLVEEVDWERFVVTVSPMRERGDVRWRSDAIAFSFEVMRARRDVLLGEDPDVELSRRARARMPLMRDEHLSEVDPAGLVLSRGVKGATLWTWAGLRANATFLAGAGLPVGDVTNESVGLPGDVLAGELRRGDMSSALPYVDPRQIDALKFSVALPAELARATLAERFADPGGAAQIVQAPVDVRVRGSLVDGYE